MRILIADDDPISRLVVATAVKNLTSDCEVAVDGSSAWDTFRAGRHDIVITDWVMPGMTGLELCSRIRELDQADSTYTYIIVITTLNQKQYRLEAMLTGADDFLPKPLSLLDLRLRIGVGTRVTDLHTRLAAQASELERLNKVLHGEVRRDGLTGAGNRMKFDEDFAVLHARAARYNTRYAVAMIDIDRFKDFNDELGHMAGDRALQDVSRSLERQVRQGDQVYRYGGEEFVVLLPEQDVGGALVGLERMRCAIENLGIAHPALGEHAVVTISAGIATRDASSELAGGEVLRRADEALYMAKGAGRNCTVVWDAEDEAALTAKMAAGATD